MDVAVFGIIVADLIGEPMDLRHPPTAGGLTKLKTLTLTTGGNVCNVGIALSRLGLKAAAAGLVGKDILGQSILERLRFEGLDISAIQTIDRAQTSATFVAVEPGGQRTFFHASGVTPLIDASTFRHAFTIIRQCAWLHLGYFGLLPTLTPELPRLLIELRQTAPGTQIALDTLDPPAEWELLKPLLPLTDLFAPSRSEAAALSGETDPRKMIRFFRSHMPRGLIGIKLDSEGCVVEADGTMIHAPAYPADVVDTTGAGDAWFAGLLVGLRNQMPLERCAKLANRVAADCCTTIGGSAGIRSLQDTLARM